MLWDRDEFHHPALGAILNAATNWYGKTYDALV